MSTKCADAPDLNALKGWAGDLVNALPATPEAATQLDADCAIRAAGNTTSDENQGECIVTKRDSKKVLARP